MTGVGKAAAVGLGAATTAFAGFTTLAVKSFAEYEQLIGGVETLFKDSADVVNRYAENAYKTAGLSANEYMSTVTSFSASLLQSLGGDTEKAAEIGNMAVMDMADNANKMGTSMEAIQNAYQGFAKQNYMMLDNLKLGYGGTKTEMERLLADAQKLTGVKYDISNLSDVYEAIHAIQVEMDITGTTAKEAEGTISGSWNSLKSSWTNVLASIASGNDEFLNDSINALVSTTGNFTKNVTGAVTNVVRGFSTVITGLLPEFTTLFAELLPVVVEGGSMLINGIITAMPKLIDEIVKALPLFFEAFTTMFPLLMQAGIDVIVSLINGIAAMMPEIIPVAVEAIITIVETLIDNIDMLVDAAIAITMALALGLIDALPLLIEKAPEIIMKLVTAIIDNAPKLISAADEIITKLSEGIAGGFAFIITKGEELVGNIKQGISDKITDIINAGEDVIKGFWNGINNAGEWLKNKIAGFFGGVVDSIKSFFGISSPSKLFENEIGAMLPAGVAVGIEGNMKTAVNAAENMNKAISDAAKSDIEVGITAETNHETQSITEQIKIYTDGYEAIKTVVITKLTEMSQSALEILRKMVSRMDLFLRVEGYNAGRNFMRALGEALIREEATLLAQALDVADAIVSIFRSRQEDSESYGSHATGLSYVPYDGYHALLHEGERVLTAAENRNYKFGSEDTTNTDDKVVINQYFYGVQEEKTAFETYRATQKAAEAVFI